MKVFISHIQEEAGVARKLKEWIESTFLGQVEVFVSSDVTDLPAGSKWLNEIDGALNSCSVFLVLCSKDSIKRPWINFETGCAWIKRVPVIPLCHTGQARSELPPPLSSFQALEIGSETFVSELLQSLASHLKIPKLPRIDETAMQKEILAAAKTVPRSHAKAIPAAEILPAGTSVDPNEAKVLEFLASHGGYSPTAEEIAQHLHLHNTKCHYYLDRLLERKMIGHTLVLGAPTQYYLTGAGRKYVVEQGLVE